MTPNAGSTADSNADSRSDSRAKCYHRSLEIDSNYSQAWNDLGVLGGGIIGGETRDVAKYLVTVGADVNVADSNGATPLHTAALKAILMWRSIS